MSVDATSLLFLEAQNKKGVENKLNRLNKTDLF